MVVPHAARPKARPNKRRIVSMTSGCSLSKRRAELALVRFQALPKSPARRCEQPSFGRAADSRLGQGGGDRRQEVGLAVHALELRVAQAAGVIQVERLHLVAALDEEIDRYPLLGVADRVVE